MKKLEKVTRWNMLISLIAMSIICFPTFKREVNYQIEQKQERENRPSFVLNSGVRTFYSGGEQYKIVLDGRSLDVCSYRTDNWAPRYICKTDKETVDTFALDGKTGIGYFRIIDDNSVIAINLDTGEQRKILLEDREDIKYTANEGKKLHAAVLAEDGIYMKVPPVKDEKSGMTMIGKKIRFMTEKEAKKIFKEV